MKKKLQLIILTSLIMIILCVIPRLSIAQGVDPGGDPDLPVDGGLSVLIAAGIGYGIKKIRDEKKKQVNNLP